jgi:hypothetical protein
MKLFADRRVNEASEFIAAELMTRLDRDDICRHLSQRCVNAPFTKTDSPTASGWSLCTRPEHGAARNSRRSSAANA